MSRTVRRKHLNRKTRFFSYYFSYYTQSQVRDSVKKGILNEWEFFSDNFGNLSKRKQFCANQAHRRKRAEFRDKAQFFMKNASEDADIIMKASPDDIKWDVT